MGGNSLDTYTFILAEYITKPTKRNKMETQVITIPITTTMDPSQLFDLVLELTERLLDDIESYGEEAAVSEGDVCVACGE